MRIGSIAGCTLLALVAACARTAPPPAAPAPANTQVLATFTGYFDPATRTVRFTTPPTPGTTGVSAESLSIFLPWSDGHTGTGPDNTLEIVTDADPAPQTITNGCGQGVNAFSGYIRLRSFFPTQSFANVYVQILDVSPIGREACNSESPGATGLDNAQGLWSYGSLGVKGSGTASATKEWRFALPDNTRFTFTGRILADLVTAANPNAEFDWNPVLTAWAPNRFVPAATTLAHLVWNGTGFVDAMSQLTFSAVGVGGVSTSVGLWAPPQSRVGPFTNTDYYAANAATGGANSVNTRGDFTACVKFKPGAHPGNDGTAKVLFGFGQAEGSGTVGWALMQMHSEYCFHYQNGYVGPNTMAYSYNGLTDPSGYAYDYICGGRNGAFIQSASHGDTLSGPVTLTDTSSIVGSNLPYVIGAYPDGSGAGTDQGVYEVIIDSRPFTGAVASEIVAAAEGRRMIDGATYYPGFVNSTTVTGIDGQPYLLPPYASVPVSTDGSGLLDVGTVVAYRPILQTSSTATGFCVAVEAQASGPWSAVRGGLFDWGGGQAFLYLSEGTVTARSSNIIVAQIPAGWTAGSRHALAMCVASGGTLSVYGDGALLDSSSGATVYDLADPSATTAIGTGGYPLESLSNARIGRVYACPDSNPASCY